MASKKDQSENAPVPPPARKPSRQLRFFDNRQKYLMFVNTCNEKWVVANRISDEIEKLQPTPPAVRVFDAGVGDGTVLTRVMRAMHAKYPTKPHYFAGKEISLEDVRLTVEKLPDRFYEHPASVVVLTNMFFSEAPWLQPRSEEDAKNISWHEVALEGSSSYEFEQQLTDFTPFFAGKWKTRSHPGSGSLRYDKPVVLVIYRDDHRFLLDSVIPRPGEARANFDLVIASQPYRLRVPAKFKAEKIIAPLSRALAPGGRLIGLHSYGDDPALEVVRGVWPEENPYQVPRHDILEATRTALGAEQGKFTFDAMPDKQSIFRYAMHTLPDELDGLIGTSTLFAAWNAAVYVAQIDDDRISEAVRSGTYLEATRNVLREHGALWFNDESYVVARNGE